MLPEVVPHERNEPPGKTFLRVSGALSANCERKSARGVFSGSEDESQLIILFGMLPEFGKSGFSGSEDDLHFILTGRMP